MLPPLGDPARSRRLVIAATAPLYHQLVLLHAPPDPDPPSLIAAEGSQP